MHGYILINCDLGAEGNVVEEMKRVPGVTGACLVFGAYDVLAEVHTETPEDFERTITHRIRRLSGVMSTMTLAVFDPE